MIIITIVSLRPIALGFVAEDTACKVLYIFRKKEKNLSTCLPKLLVPKHVFMSMVYLFIFKFCLDDLKIQ